MKELTLIICSDEIEASDVAKYFRKNEILYKWITEANVTGE